MTLPTAVCGCYVTGVSLCYSSCPLSLHYIVYSQDTGTLMAEIHTEEPDIECAMELKVCCYPPQSNQMPLRGAPGNDGCVPCRNIRVTVFLPPHRGTRVDRHCVGHGHWSPERDVMKSGLVERLGQSTSEGRNLRVTFHQCHRNCRRVSIGLHRFASKYRRISSNPPPPQVRSALGYP